MVFYKKSPTLEGLMASHPELIDRYNALEERLCKINNRQSQLREMLKERAFFPKDSNYFKRYELEYQELYFKKAKLTKEINEILEEVTQLRATDFDKKN